MPKSDMFAPREAAWWGAGNYSRTQKGGSGDLYLNIFVSVLPLDSPSPALKNNAQSGGRGVIEIDFRCPNLGTPGMVRRLIYRH